MTSAMTSSDKRLLELSLGWAALFAARLIVQLPLYFAGDVTALVVSTNSIPSATTTSIASRSTMVATVEAMSARSSPADRSITPRTSAGTSRRGSNPGVSGAKAPTSRHRAASCGSTWSPAGCRTARSTRRASAPRSPCRAAVLPWSGEPTGVTGQTARTRSVMASRGRGRAPVAIGRVPRAVAATARASCRATRRRGLCRRAAP